MATDQATGKKSGSEKRQRSGIIGVRVSDEERLELEEQAERAGLTLASYVRMCCLTAPKNRAVRRPPVEKKLLAQLLGQLGKVGGNVHQIAKRLNFNEPVANDDIKEAIADFRETAAAIMQALGKRPK